MHCVAPSKLALGAVQFGLTYGIANTTGQIEADEARVIVERARAAGLDTIDTAIVYGESEQRLGTVGVRGWRVVTKLPPVPADVTDIERWVLESLTGSLQRLRLDRVAGLLLHRAADLVDHGARLYAAMADVRSRGLAEKIGISIYEPAELDASSRYQLDLVQAPYNVFDRRLASSGWLQRLKDGGTEVHTRSAFLQGLVLMTPDKRPPAFSRWETLWRRWDSWLASSGYSALEASLGFALGTAGIDRVVVGVDSAAQLAEIIHASGISIADIPAQLATNDLDLISPNRWRPS